MKGAGSMLYAGAIIIILFFAIAGIIGHSIVESEKWFRIFKKRERDD